MSSSENEKSSLDNGPPVLNNAVKVEQKRTWKSKVWSNLDLPPAEARFLTKLDLTLLTAAALGVMIRYLDQVNITNAFNSGMKEDLNLNGNELNYANAFWSAAYVFGQIPSNMILTRVRAPYYVAFLELSWTICTFATAAVKTVPQLYAIRFLVGLFEAGHFPAVMYIASSYYKPHELGRRNTIIQVFTSVGPMFSGFLMAAVYKGLNNHGGLPGWRWLFIICGVISFPCGVWTAFALPDLPSRARPNWLYNAQDIELARERMPTEKKLLTGLFKIKDVIRWHKHWSAWTFPVFFLFVAQLGQSSGSMIFWVKSYNVKGKPAVYSVEQINLIPIGLYVLNVTTSLISSWISDNIKHARRWPFLIFASIVGIILPIALAATPVHPKHKSQRFALYYLFCLSSSIGGLCWTAVNEVNRSDPERRAYISALMNAFTYVFTAWVPIFTFPTNKQPYIVKGNYINAGFMAGALLIAIAIAYFTERDRKLAERNDAEAIREQESVDSLKQ